MVAGARALEECDLDDLERAREPRGKRGTRPGVGDAIEARGPCALREETVKSTESRTYMVGLTKWPCPSGVQRTGFEAQQAS